MNDREVLISVLVDGSIEIENTEEGTDLGEKHMILVVYFLGLMCLS